MKNRKDITPLSYKYYFYPTAIIAIAGFLTSIYLLSAHFRVYTDINYQSFCAISRSFNCDTVSQSPYSIFLGLPVPLWGIIGYAFFLYIMAFTRPSKNDPQHLWTFLFFVAFGFTVYSIVLALISTFYIQSYCIMCILSYAVNLILLYLTWIVRKRFKCGSFYPAFKNDFKYILNRPRSLVAGILIFGSIILALFLFLPSYWELTAPTLSRNISTGVTSDGHPWIGADKPKLEIVEFSDYRCFQCKKMHFYLRKLISSYPDKIRLIHRHFPMDNVINPIVKKPFHKGTAKLAIFSMAAAEMGKFWEVNDLIYSIPRQANTVNFQKLAAKAGLDFQKIKPLLQDRNLWNRLIKDIKEGLKYKITGTPCFIINKQVYSGRIPPDVFRKHGIL